VECVVIVEEDARVLKAGLKLLRQPPFDAPDVTVKGGRGEIRKVARLIAIRKAAEGLNVMH
jgi:hypothetical protein